MKTEHLFKTGEARTAIVDPSSSRRRIVADVLRDLGYENQETFGNLKDLLNFVEVEDLHWVVTPVLPNDEVTAFHVLSLLSSHAQFLSTRMSLLVQNEESAYLPGAFSMGLLSAHTVSYVKDPLKESFEELVRLLKATGWSTVRTSANYIRRMLTERRDYQRLLAFEQDLMHVVPGQMDQLVNLANAFYTAGQPEQALNTLAQAELIAPQFREKLQTLCTRIRQKSELEAPPTNAASYGRNLLGVENVVVITSDDATSHFVNDALAKAGAPHIETCSDGQEAWQHLKRAEQMPDLILSDMAIEELSLPVLLQNLGHHWDLNTAVVAMSPNDAQQEKQLLHELGVDELLPKPLPSESEFLRHIIRVLKQSRAPTEQRSLERKIRKLLSAGERAEAERLRLEHRALPNLSEPAKLTLDAEFAYYDGHYETASSLALTALQQRQQSLPLLDILGKCLLKTKNYTAALECFEDADSFAPQNIHRLCQMAEAQAQIGSVEDAAKTIDKARELGSEIDTVDEVDAGISIQRGQTDRAKELMGQLESLKWVMGFMNNRAVALIQAGRFEEGIEIYKKTQESLPEAWADVYNAVAYNLGLAYSRYGELENAAEELSGLDLTRSPEGLAKKCKSLLHRIRQSQKTGTALRLALNDAEHRSDASPDLEEGGPESSKTAFSSSISADVMSRIRIRKGDMCCYHIYRCSPNESQEIEPLTVKPPRFTPRDVIARDESHGHKNAGSH